MKILKLAFFAAAFALCSNLFAVSHTIGDSVSYVRNSKRTSKKVMRAEGKLTVIETPRGYSCNGTTIEMAYKISVLIKGKQEGSIGLCVPNSLLDPNFYGLLARIDEVRSYGAFKLSHDGMTSATSASGIVYGNCHELFSNHIDDHFKATTSEHAQVLWVTNSGSIERVDNIEVKFKAADGVKVLGAVTVDVSGVSGGTSFEVGFDME